MCIRLRAGFSAIQDCALVLQFCRAYQSHCTMDIALRMLVQSTNSCSRHHHVSRAWNELTHCCVLIEPVAICRLETSLLGSAERDLAGAGPSDTSARQSWVAAQKGTPYG